MMDDRDRIVYLDITSWQGMSIGATHYYGKLRGYIGKEYKTVELEYTMTARDAARLNKIDRDPGFGDYFWAKGEKSSRFETEEKIEAVAIATYKAHYPDAIFLAVGDSGTGEPRRCIDGPDPIKAQMNELYARYEAERGKGWWEGRWGRYDAYNDEWQALKELAEAAR